MTDILTTQGHIDHRRLNPRDAEMAQQGVLEWAEELRVATGSQWTRGNVTFYVQRSRLTSTEGVRFWWDFTERALDPKDLHENPGNWPSLHVTQESLPISDLLLFQSAHFPPDKANIAGKPDILCDWFVFEYQKPYLVVREESGRVSIIQRALGILHMGYWNLGLINE